MRKRSDSLNETNIRRGSCGNENLRGITDGFQKFTMKTHNAQPIAAKHVQTVTLSSLDVFRKPPAPQKDEGRGGYRLLDRILTSMGFCRTNSSLEGDENSKQPNIASDLNECSLPSEGIVEETKSVLDFHKIGLFWTIDLQSAHADFLTDIIQYAFSIQAFYPSTTKADWDALGGCRTFGLTNIFIIEIFYSQRLPTEVQPLAAYLVAVTVSKYKICRYQLEDLSIAAVRLAMKVESQHALSKEILEEFNIISLNSLERKICRATDFHLLKCSMLFFMRIIQKLVERHSWQWKFAKFASQLACCQIELITLKPALLAGVVMRLTCLLADKNGWPQECYAVLGEPSIDYDFPQSILCRLILTARISEEFKNTYARYYNVVEHAISLRPGWIESQAATASEVAMLGSIVFEEQ